MSLSFGFFFPIFAIWLKMWTVDMDGDRKQVIHGMYCEMKMSKGRKSRRPSYENKFHMKAWQQMLDKPGGFPMCYVGMASPFSWWWQGIFFRHWRCCAMRQVGPFGKALSFLFFIYIFFLSFVNQSTWLVISFDFDWIGMAQKREFTLELIGRREIKRRKALFLRTPFAPDFPLKKKLLIFE